MCTTMLDQNSWTLPLVGLAMLVGVLLSPSLESLMSTTFLVVTTTVRWLTHAVSSWRGAENDAGRNAK